MTRSLPFGFSTVERATALAPTAELAWSDRYLGRPTLRASADADDGGVAAYTACLVSGTTLVMLKSNGANIQARRRQTSNLNGLAAWSTIATSTVSGSPVGLTSSGSTIFAFYLSSSATLAYRTSTDDGATWSLGVTLRTAAAGNTLWNILTGDGGIVSVEERFAGSTARLYTYQWSAGWALVDTLNTGATTLEGGGIDSEDGTLLVFAGNYLETTIAGAVTLRKVRVYDLTALSWRGTVHQGSAGGVMMRGVKPIFLSASNRRCLLAVLQIPRGSGDASDRVALWHYSGARVGGRHPLSSPRTVYAVEDAEYPSVAYGDGALFVFTGTRVDKLVEGSDSGTLTASAVELEYHPEDERLRVEGPGSVDVDAVQIRCRLGLGADLVEMGIFWIASRVAAGREGYAVECYGLWGVLERELQQMSIELLQTNDDPMTPGEILELIFKGLGFSYAEDASLSADLHPAVDARLTWSFEYGEPFATLVRGLLRWTGCEVRPGVDSANKASVYVMRPGSRFGPTPGIAVNVGASGDHPMLGCVIVDPETVTDATILPGGWDHQITLEEPYDRQLVLNASEASDLTTMNIVPATRALARALAGADAGYVRCRPALEIEQWDTVSVTDGPAGLADARRLVRSVRVAAGRGAWVQELELGLE